MFDSACLTLLFTFSLLASGQNPSGPAPSAQSAAPAALTQGMESLRANHPREALTAFEQALQSDPNNVTANLLAATSALELYQGPLAVRYAEKARQLDPHSWKIHTTLVAAYTAAGLRPQRDRERTLLRQLHATGDPDARRANGFLLEMFPSAAGSPNRVDAVEYFEPVGKFHTYYRFLVRQPDGQRLKEIDVQSNDFDQKSWAAAHPAQAQAGERQYQITGHGASPNARATDYRMFSGKPDYDTIRAMVIQILGAQPAARP